MGNVLRRYDYFPYGESVPIPDGTALEAQYLFSGKEKQDHLFALDWYDSGARFQTADGIFISIDPLAEKYYHISPYAYCAGNPILFIDSNGAWIWNKNGDLVSEDKDNVGTLATFLNVSLEEAGAMILRNTPDFRGMAQNYVLKKENIWTESIEKSSITVSNTLQAWNHYKNGHGETADVGRRAQDIIMSTSVFKNTFSDITNNPSISQRKIVSVNLTGRIFHIGKTSFQYEINRGDFINSVTFYYFEKDSFSDPLFIIESKNSKNTKRHPDEFGPNLEMGGTPYYYAKRSRTYFFKPVHHETDKQ